MGFEYFYGFMGGETDQWTPYLFRDHTQIFPWIGKPGYNLTTDLADEAIQHMRTLNATAPDKPFFVYYVPGGSHSPHQPTKEWIDKFKGKFDMGWNAMREQIFANQKRLGRHSRDDRSSPSGRTSCRSGTRCRPTRRSSSPGRRKCSRAYAAYTDHEIGRVIQEVEDMGKLDNTLIIYICGDNGTSPEGTLVGTPNQFTAYNGFLDVPVEEQMKFYDNWGSAATYPHMAVAWAWAFDTPFKWTKQVASHFGGTRQGMAISWPARIKDAGGIRTQFHHIIDIVPTILEATGVKAPEMVDGIKQKPIEGVSMAYTFDKANADAPSTRTTQYFEMAGNRGIYHDGWYANTTPPVAPWVLNAPMPDINDYKWELYNISDDYSQANDLAAKMPDKLKEMQALFDRRGEEIQRVSARITRSSSARSRRGQAPTAGQTVFTYSGVMPGIPAGSAPNILNRSFTITAEVDVPRRRRGMIVTEGGWFGGYGLYLLKGKPVFTYNLLGACDAALGGRAAARAGQAHDRVRLQIRRPGLRQGRHRRLRVDGQDVASLTIPHTIPFLIPAGRDLRRRASTPAPG